MPENFKIETSNLRMANLQLLKENLAYSMVLGEMMLPIYCQLMNKDKNESAEYFKNLYSQRLEEIDIYIKAEYGHLDIGDLLGAEKDGSK